MKIDFLLIIIIGEKRQLAIDNTLIDAKALFVMGTSLRIPGIIKYIKEAKKIIPHQNCFLIDINGSFSEEKKKLFHHHFIMDSDDFCMNIEQIIDDFENGNLNLDEI